MLFMSDRILLVRPDRMGDVVLTSACLFPLRAAYPDAQIYFCIQPLYHCLYEEMDVLDGVWDASMSEDDLSSKMREYDINVIIFLHPYRRFENASKRAGVALRVGFVDNKRDLTSLTHPILSRKHLGLKHEAAYSFDLLKVLNVSCPDVLAPLCHPHRGAKDKVDALMNAGRLALHYAVMHLGAHAGKPRLPTSYYISVSESLFKQGIQVVLIGVDKEDSSILDFLEKVKAPDGLLLSLVGKLELAELAWLLNSAAVYFSRDTGPAHLAAAMGCPTVTVIPNPTKKTSAKRWHPLGPSSICIEKEYFHFDFEDNSRLARRHLKKVSQEEVVNAVLKVMRGRAVSR